MSAEKYHQDYYAQNPDQGYCQIVIAPKVAKFRKAYLDRLKKRLRATRDAVRGFELELSVSSRSDQSDSVTAAAVSHDSRARQPLSSPAAS